MPRVPEYNRQEGRGALPTPYQNAPGPNGLDEFGRGLQHLGGAVAQIQEQAAQTQVTEALNAFDEAATKRLYDPKDGLLHKRGSGVLGADAATYKGLEEDRQKILRDLPSDRARSLFLEHTQKALGGYHRQIENFVGGQINQARTAALGNAENRALDRIARGDFTDPEAYQATLDAVENRHQALSNSPEEYDARTQEFRQKASILGMRSWLRSGDLDGAIAFLDRHQPDMGAEGGEFRVKVEALVKDRAAGEEASKILARHVDKADPMDPWVNLATLQAEANGASEEVAKKLHGKIADEKTYQKVRIDQVSGEAWAAFAAGGRRLDAVPVDTQMWLQKRAGKVYEQLVQADARRIREADLSERERKALRNQALQQALLDMDDMDVGEVAALNRERFAIPYGLEDDPASKRSIEAKIAKARAVVDAGNKGNLEKATKEFMAGLESFVTQRTPSQRADIRKKAEASFKSRYLDRADEKGNLPPGEEKKLIAEALNEEYQGWWVFETAKPSQLRLNELSKETEVPVPAVDRIRKRIVAQEHAKGNTEFKVEDVSKRQIKDAYAEEKKKNPPAAPAAPEKPSGDRPPLATRVEQLKQEGITKEQAKARLRAEGYKL